MKEFRELTKAELPLMDILWEKQKCFINDILSELPEPKPAYNTVSTLVRILVQKGFVSYKSYGKTYEYFPIITREEYLNGYVESVKTNLFQGSFSSMISFFAKKEKLSKKQIEDIISEIEE